MIKDSNDVNRASLDLANKVKSSIKCVCVCILEKENERKEENI